MTNRFGYMLGLIALGMLPGIALAQSSCPTEVVSTRRIAVRFARSADYAATRSAHQLPTLDSTQVRTLTQQQGDATTCTKITTLVQATESGALANPDLHLTYFQAGTFYYVVAVRADALDSLPPGIVRTGFQVLWVVDAKGGKAKLVARIAV